MFTPSRGRALAVACAFFFPLLSKTPAAAQSLSSAAITSVAVTSLTANWGSTYPGGTLYYAQLSTNASFAAPVTSSNTFALSAAFTGLTPHTTYYAQVATAAAGPFTALGSTVPLQFVRQELPGTAGYALRIGLGDLDGDGDLDAALAQYTTLNETVLRNDGGGAFTQVTIAGSGGASNAIAVCDLDSDGDLDLLVGNDSNQDEVVYRNDGALSFTKITLTGTSGNTKAVSCGDYDGDGDQDALVANDSGQSLVLLRNDGGLSFVQTTLSGTGANNRDVKWLDYDSDGDLDVFVGVSGDEAVLRNDGDAGFTKVALAGTGGDSVRAALADYDLDGDLDALLTNVSGQRTTLFSSDGAGGFVPLPLMSSTGTYDAAWGDYDGDGDPDALFGEAYGDDYLARNEGNGAFTRIELTGSKGNSNSAAWGDFDGDGDLDILLGKALTKNAVLMLNQGSVVNAAPGAPGGVALAFADSPSSAALTVTWSAAAYDGPLSTAGLSYALVVATAPMALSGDSMRVTSPAAFVAAWNHGTPPGGNAQKPLTRVWPGDSVAKHGQRFRLDLDGVLRANFKSDATYYVRLQTIDAGLARSTWSDEVSAYFLRSAPAASAAPGGPTSLAASYSTSGAAGYLLQASTAPNFSGTLFAAAAASAAASVTLAGLEPATTYYLRFGALWQRTTVWATPTPASTTTSPAPSLSSGPFAGVSTGALTATWASTFPGGTLYYAQLSTNASFAAPVTSSNTYGLSASFDGLTANMTYYAQVATAAAGPFTSLGSTVTLMQPPTSVFFDEVSTHSLVVSAYAPTPAFSNLGAGLSGTNVALDGSYAGWRGERWTTKAAMSAARYAVKGAVVNGKIYAIGGYNGGNLSTNAEYDPAADAWTAKTAMPTARHSFAIGVLNGKVYAMGGESTAVLATNQEYDPATNAWTTKASLPEARSQMPTAVHGGRLHLYGGFTTQTVATQIVYDPDTNSWSSKASLPTPRNSAAAGSFDSDFIVGGATGSVALAVNEAYVPGSDSWVSRAPMPTARSIAFTGSVGGKMYVIGGEIGFHPGSAANEEYDPQADTWTARAPLPTPRRWGASATVKGKIYAIGGGNGTTLDVNEEYDPGVAHVFTGLQPNTQYAFKAKARNLAGVETPESGVYSTYTWAAVPAAATPTFAGLFVSSVTLAWTANGNPGGTEYRLGASTRSDFAAWASSAVSGWQAALTATLPGLSANSTWYFRVQARNAVGVETAYASLGATVTAIEAPTTLYFEEVSSHSVVAWAYAPGAGALKASGALSAVNIARDGVFAGWKSDAWAWLPPMTSKRNDGGLVAYGGRLYAFGGHNGTSYLATSEMFDPLASTWTARASMPGTKANFGTALVGGKAYALGGANGTLLSSTYVYDIAANAWTTRAAMAVARSLFGAVVLGGRIHIVGGNNGAVHVTTHEAYDPDADAWSSQTAFPVAWGHGSASALDGVAYLAAGSTGTAGNTVSTRVEAFSAGAWTTKASLPLPPRRAARSAAVGGRLYVLGGTNLSADQPYVDEYDPGADAWVRYDSSAPLRTDFGIAVLNGRIYGAGGGDPVQVTSTAWSYDLGRGRHFAGLSPNTQYAFKAKARNLAGLETAESAVFSTYTWAAVPAAATPTFTGVFVSSVTLAWTANANPGGTEYRLKASSAPDFNGAASSVTGTWGTALTGALSGLSANSTWHFRVQARNAVGVETAWAALGSTATAIEPPTSVYFDDVSTHSLVVSAYAPTPAFSNLGTGLSGTNIAKDGSFAGWRGERWTTKTSMTTARYGVRVAAANGRLYAIGGYNGGNLSINAEYDPASNAWTAKTSMPTARHSFGIGTLNGKIYAVGGESTVSLTVNQEYDPATNAWTTKASLSTPRVQVPALAVDGKLHFMGGHNGTVVVGLHQSYNPLTDAWETQTSLPDARQGAGAGLVGGKAYLFGGEAASILAFNREFDFGTNAWVTKSTMPTGRGNLAYGVIGGKIYAVGGKIGAPPGTAAAEEYDPAADVWAARTPSPTNREWVGGAVVAGRLYVIGGSNGTPLATNEEYDPGVAHVFTGLQPNTQYVFKAKARNLAGVETAESASFSTYTLAASPGSPAFSSVGTGTLTLQWTVNGNPGGTEFQAQLSSSSAFASSLSAGWTADLTSASFGGLASGTTWYGRVRSRNAAGVPGDYAAAGSTRTAYVTPAGCAVVRDVAKAGAPYGTITAALAAVPASLTAETCVVVRDTATYMEQVTVAGKIPNGFRLRLMRDPALSSGALVAPPAASTAAFRIQTASVSIEGLTAAPAVPVGWGVYVTSPNATLTAVLVQTTVTLAVAGIELESWGRVEYSTVAVANTRAVYFNGAGEHHNVLWRSTFSNASAANHAVWMSGPDNTVSESSVHNTKGVAVMLGAVNAVVDRSTLSAGVAGNYAVSFAAGSSSATVSRSYIVSSVGRGLSMGGSYHTVSESTVSVSAGTEYGLVAAGLTHSTISKVFAYSAGGASLYLYASSNWNRIEGSTVVADGSAWAALVQASSRNVVSGSLIRASSSTALKFDSGSHANSVLACTLQSDAPNSHALHLASATSHYIASSFITNTAGLAAYLSVKADGNLIDLSTMTTASGYSALYVSQAATNTVTRSYLYSLAGTGVTFGVYTSSNTLLQSTVAASGATGKAVSIDSSADSLVADSWLLSAGYGLYVERGERALVLRSTVTGAGSVPAARVSRSSGTVLRDSYVSGPDALAIYTSTATTVERSRLQATGGSGKALEFLQGSNGLSVASVTLSAAALGVVIEDGARGPFALSSFSVTASTGLQFTGGTQVATVTLGAFAAGTAVNVDATALSGASRITMRDASGARTGTAFESDPSSVVDWIPDANPLLYAGPFSAVSSGSLTASWTGGFSAGTLYYAQVSTSAAFVTAVLSSNTLNSAASFSGLDPHTTYYAQVGTAAAGPFTALGSTRTRPGDIPGCALSLFVLNSGGGDCTTIQRCLDLVPGTPFAGDACVQVRDSGTYSEQVTVLGKVTNGYRLRLEAAPGMSPVVNPPSGANAGLRVLNASVSVAGLTVRSTNTVAYGIFVSSVGVTLSNVAVDSGGKINTAGIQLGTGAALSYASVTVQNADGVRIVGSSNTVSFTTASVVAFSRGAFYLLGAASNTVHDSFGYGNPGYGAFLYHSNGNTLARTELRKLSVSAGAAGLYLNDSSSNVVTGSFISNAGGPGADLAVQAHGNLVELSTITAAGAVYDGLSLGTGRGNRLSRVYVFSAAGNAGSLSSGASETLVEFSTFVSAAAGARALGTNGSSETLTGNHLYAPNGTALGLFGSSITVTLTTGAAANASYPALFVAGGGHMTLRDSSFSNSAGDGGKLERTSYVDILRSTVSGAGGGAGLKVEGASSNTVTASRLAAPGGVGLSVGLYFEAFDFSTVFSTGNVFSGLSISASTAVSVGAAPGLVLSSSVLAGDAQGAALAFGDAVLVATFTGLAFPAGAAWSAEAALLPAGSRITVRDASGAQGGSLYENDPLSRVDWLPDLVPFLLPSAPTAPSGIVLGASSISWTWGPVANAQSYRVYSSSSGSLLATSASTGAVVTGLLPASTHSVVVAGVARGENGPLSPSATAHTDATPPAGLALDQLYVSSAALSWSLEDNPAETLAELQRSTDGASYAVRAGTLAPSAVDSGLLGCTSYYYRVRHKSPAGVASPFDGPLLVRTAASTPAAPGDLSAQSVPGRRVALTWSGSQTEGIVAYRLYKDTGAGAVDYAAPYAEFGPTVFSTTTVALSSGAVHLFGLRAVHRCGVEEANTHAVASAWALESLDGVRAGIKVPATGKKISGNRVLVMAELDTGSPVDVSSILFQYRSTGSAAWTDIPAANSNHPNPDREQPYFVHWDVTALADRAYDLRAVATDVLGASDPAPGSITVLVDSVGFEVRETDLGAGRVKKEQAVSNETTNTVAAAGSGSAVVTKVVLPAGALNTAGATLSATPNPAALPSPPTGGTSIGASIEVTLSNGQSQLSNGQTAAIVFNYPDDDGDGVIDGTTVRAEDARIQTFDVPTGKWKTEFATALDKDKRTLTGQTPHFSLFAAFGVISANLDSIRVYPNPYKPNGGNPDEGRTFSRADPLSGVVFDNLPAQVTIKIYTLTGRLVSEFGTSAGAGAVQWDGKNDQGEDVASGGYFAVITSPGSKPVIKKIGVIR